MRLFSLGFTCNNACLFCAQGSLREGASIARGDATPASEGAIDSIAPGEAVAFVGGEPTIDERLLSWITAADQRGARRILVQTNGRRLAYKSYARAIAATSKRLAIEVSLHGSTEAMHEHHTSAPGSFSQTVRGLRNATAEGIPAGVTTVVTRSSYRHLVEIVTLARALGATAARFVAVEPLGRARSPGIAAPAELAAPFVKRAIDEARRAGLAIATEDGARDRFAGLGLFEAPAENI